MLMTLVSEQNIKALNFMKSIKESKKIFVELAKTPYKQSQGLMFRKELQPDSGMLFVFDNPKRLSFWGMNTFIPLDIAFIDERGIIRDLKRIKQHDLTSVKSSCPCKFALEVSDGWFKENGFEVGDFMESLLKDSDGHIMLIKNKGNQKTAQVIPDEELEEDVESNIIAPEKEEKPVIEKEKPEVVSTPNVPEAVAPVITPEPEEVGVSVPKFDSIFDALRWSMANLQVMRITYKTVKGHTVTKDIEPHKVFFSRSSKRQVLKAYDETADHASQYIIMNIVSYGFPGRKFAPRSILLSRRLI
jgi:uncharacterized membrane protein (UPF0127 family)